MYNATNPPELATRILRWVLPDFSREAILGDLQESFAQLTLERGAQAAGRWYWSETLQSLPGFTMNALHTKQLWRQIVTGNTLNNTRQDSLMAGIGLLLLVPALLVEGFAVAYVLSGRPMAAVMNTPGLSHLMAAMEGGYLNIAGAELPIGILVLAGILLAAIINFFAVVQIKLETVEDGYMATLTARRKLWNLLLLALVAVLLLGMDWLIS